MRASWSPKVVPISFALFLEAMEPLAVLAALAQGRLGLEHNNHMRAMTSPAVESCQQWRR
jgi:hypothetical protein